mmetsp:Transcript_73343/g.212436  ORF Transcript_73343/g.212436 Transcript_73343/m.212436 type:complete len:254 (+) Transcript_73343:293-1054(+)
MIIGSRIFKGKTPLSAFAGMHPLHMSFAVDKISPPGCRPTTFCNHSEHTSSACLSSGTYATMASCDNPAEKTILPIWPEPPLRSSSLGSDLAFMAFTDSTNKVTSPSGSSTEVQKNCKPPMSAAPSISTPRLPPSLITFFNFFAGSSGGFSSFGFSACSFSFFSCAFLMSFLFIFTSSKVYVCVSMLLMPAMAFKAPRKSASGAKPAFSQASNSFFVNFVTTLKSKQPPQTTRCTLTTPSIELTSAKISSSLA